MKNKWLIVFCIFVIALIATSLFFKDNPEDYYNDITYSELNDKINDKKDFILYIKQTDCNHCKSFTPKFTGVLSKYSLKADVLNLTNLSDDEREKAIELLKIDGTPAVFFYKDGVKTDVNIEGDKDKDLIIQKLKEAGYVK